LPCERRLCEPDGFRIQRATNPQRHIQWCDKAEATTALIIPIVIVGIKRQPLAHFLDAAREFPPRDDGANTDGARARLFADAHAASLRARVMVMVLTPLA